MAEYWVKFSWNVSAENTLGQTSDQTNYLYFMGQNTAVLFYNDQLRFSGSTLSVSNDDTTAWWSPFDDNIWLTGTEQYTEYTTADGQPHFTQVAFPTLVLHANIDDYYIIGSRPDPTNLLGPLAETSVSGNEIDEGTAYAPTYLKPTGPITATFATYAWAIVDILPTLFTNGSDVVDFNNLTPDQKAAIAGGADLYSGLGGNDVVTLPSIANYNESVGDGKTLGWNPSQTFSTGSLAGQTYTINGGDGSYNIALDAGNDTVTINGNGNSTITAGTSSAGIAITHFSGSLTGSAPSSSPGATVKLIGADSGNVAIGGNSTLELATGSTLNGTISFGSSGGGILKIDGTTPPTNPIAGFSAGDTIMIDGNENIDQAIIVKDGNNYDVDFFDPTQPFGAPPSLELILDHQFTPDELTVTDQNNVMALSEGSQKNPAMMYNGVDTSVFDIDRVIIAAKSAVDQNISDLSTMFKKFVSGKPEESIIKFVLSPAEFGQETGKAINNLLNNPTKLGISFLKGLFEVDTVVGPVQFATAFAEATYTIEEVYRAKGTVGINDIADWDLTVAKGAASMFPFGEKIAAIGSSFVSSLIDQHFNYLDQILLESTPDKPFQIVPLDPVGDRNLIFLNDENQVPNLPNSSESDLLITTVDILESPVSVQDITGSGSQPLTLVGNDSNNVITAGTGDDTMTGGGGADTFVVSQGTDEITDFSREDTIEADSPDARVLSESVADGKTTILVDTIGNGQVGLTVILDGVFGKSLIRSEENGVTDFSFVSSDILWQNTSGQVAIWEMAGTTPINQYGVNPNPGPNWKATGTGDFNADGHADILWQNTSTGQATIWEMNGSTRTGGGAVSLNPGPTWTAVGTGDFNGDGLSDILWRNASTGQASVWEMDENTRTGGGAISVNPGPTWRAVGTGEFNGDRESDILWQNANGQVAVWEMNGNTRTGGGPVTPNPGPSWKAIGTGDFNHDGLSDIVFQNVGTGQVSIWDMDGNTRIGGGAVSAIPGPSWHAIGTGGGGSDILFQNTSGQTSIWEMDGTTRIGGGPVSPNPGPSWRAVDLT